MKRRAIDLCAGAGGLSLGLLRAGWDVMGVERDVDAVDTYHNNIGRCILRDLREYHPRSPAALVCGGPPCQPFSDAGLREGTDREDGRLWEELLRIAIEASAPAIMLENVRGFATWREDETAESALKAEHAEEQAEPLALPGFDAGARPRETRKRKPRGRLFIERVREELLRRGGYHTTWRLLNAADYAVPQKRLRVFLVGFRDPSILESWRWPMPTNAPPGDMFFDNYRTVREALRLSDQEYKTGRRDGAKGWQGERMLDVDRPAPTVGTRNNGELLSPLDRPANTVCIGSRGSGGDPFPNMKYRKQIMSDLQEAGLLDRPSTTIQCDTRVARAGHHDRQQNGAVRLRPDHLAILQGFPLDFQFVGNVESRCRQIGNAVPPPLARL